MQKISAKKHLKETFGHTKIDTWSFSILAISGIFDAYPNMEIYYQPA